MIPHSNRTNIASIIIKKDSANTKSGGDIYINKFIPISNIQLAFIDADRQKGSYKRKTGRTSSVIEIADKYIQPDWEDMIESAYLSLSDSGLLILFSCAESSAQIKLILDRIFGADKFVNQIIWHYSAPGSAKNHFLKRHSVIYIYAKTLHYHINTLAAGRKREDGGRVHLKLQRDQDGRSFYSVARNGQIVKYYNDVVLPFDDVWHIPQINSRSPQSEGYPGQKPKELIDRLLLCLSCEGDVIADFTCSGGTALLSAFENNRSFIGFAQSQLEAHIAYMRLLRAGCEQLIIHNPSLSCSTTVNINLLSRPGCSEVYFDGYGLCASHSPLRSDELSYVDIWSIGQVINNSFICDDMAVRNSECMSLKNHLMAEREKNIAVFIADAYGKEKIIILK